MGTEKTQKHAASPRQAVGSADVGHEEAMEATTWERARIDSCIDTNTKPPHDKAAGPSRDSTECRPCTDQATVEESTIDMFSMTMHDDADLDMLLSTESGLFGDSKPPNDALPPLDCTTATSTCEPHPSARDSLSVSDQRSDEEQDAAELEADPDHKRTPCLLFEQYVDTVVVNDEKSGDDEESPGDGSDDPEVCCWGPAQLDMPACLRLNPPSAGLRVCGCAHSPES